MNIDDYGIILLVVISWPLLLAFPAVHTRLPFAHYLVLAPAVLLALFPGETTVTPAWLLFGAEFQLDNNNRWLLVMAIGIWLAAATTCNNFNNDNKVNDSLISGKTFSFFSLTLAGHLGTILSADAVSFFCCSTLMGYGFYGLIVRQNDEASRWAGRFYIGFLIIADLLVFESILLAAHDADKLQFNSLHKAIIDGNISTAYVWLVSIAFMIKAGVWPAHIWLTASFNSAARPACILLTGVPVAMGLLGLIRWLPVGEIVISDWGIYFLVLGVITVLYALIQFINKGYQSRLPALVTLFMTGLFVTGLGAVMTRPELWHDYGYLAYPCLALLGIISAALSYIRITQPQTGGTLLNRLIERGLRLMDILQNTQLSSTGKLFSKINTRVLSTRKTCKTKSEHGFRFIDEIEHQLRFWPVIITILTLFLVTIIYLASLTV